MSPFELSCENQIPIQYFLGDLKHTGKTDQTERRSTLNITGVIPLLLVHYMITVKYS
jgi:hypothetical protein